MKLHEQSCIPCHGGIPPLSKEERQTLLTELNGWAIIDDHHLFREFSFKNFASALNWVNQIGAVAEQMGHHPDITLSWGSVCVTIWTHKINNLTGNDFILAAKINELWKDQECAR